MSNVQDGSRDTKDAQGAEGDGQAEAGPLQQQEGAAAGGISGATGGGGGQGSAPSRKEVILDRIRSVEAEMARWRRRHSQSDPGAVWELRELQQELAHWKGMLRVLG